MLEYAHVKAQMILSRMVASRISDQDHLDEDSEWSEEVRNADLLVVGRGGARDMDVSYSDVGVRER